MADMSETMLHAGVEVDVLFGNPKPRFGDLFLICGEPNPAFPPTGAFGFYRLADLQFSQVDDFFGVRTLAGDGADVVIWLYPLVGGRPVHRQPGPFDGVRLAYNVLRNPARHAGYYLRCVEAFASLGVQVTYHSRGVRLGSPPNLAPVRDDIDEIVRHWAAEGVVVGSSEALEIDF